MNFPAVLSLPPCTVAFPSVLVEKAPANVDVVDSLPSPAEKAEPVIFGNPAEILPPAFLVGCKNSSVIL